MQLFTRSFQETTPIVVSRVLKVTEASGHQPGSKVLQNKENTDGGISVDSLMPKLDREKIESVNVRLFFSIVFFHTFVTMPSLFMKGDDDPLFMESG